jgi:dTDP-4-amino-4,6-dideoxygalactose transaminase
MHLVFHPVQMHYLLALMAIDIKPGDEVIVPTYSFFATAGVVSRLFAKPVLVENDPVTFNMDPKDFEKENNIQNKSSYSSTSLWPKC